MSSSTITNLGFTNQNGSGSLSTLSWQGLTFQQVVGSLQKNTNTSTSTKSFFYPRPIKSYRRNIGNTGVLNSSSNERQSVTISATMEQPGGMVKTTIPICSNNGVGIKTDPNIINSTYENGVCNTSAICMTPQVNSLKRVRSAGMIRKRNYNVNSYQMLDNRDKTFAQNQFNYLNTGNSGATAGSPLALLTKNTYVQNGSGQFNVANNTVIYKPSNWKFANQGGVSSSSRTERLKYDNMQKVAYNYKQTYGVDTRNYALSVTYGGTNGNGSSVTYGAKNKMLVPTPKIVKVRF
jgi:hypothetical protein